MGVRSSAGFPEPSGPTSSPLWPSPQIITSEEAERRGQIYDRQGATYLFDLDYALAWASLAQRSPASSVLARAWRHKQILS